MIDPEAFERTEELFSASTEVSTAASKRLAHRVRARYSPPRQAQEAGIAASAVAAAPATGIERAMAERQALESSLQHQAECWRDEVADRVERYRTRRSRKRLAGEFSMRLDFGPQHAALPAASGPITEGATAVAPVLAPPEPEPEPVLPQARTEAMTCVEPALRIQEEVVPPPALEASWEPVVTNAATEPATWTPQAPVIQAPPVREVKVIEFPRALVFPDFQESDASGLAEPILDRPRILDVPENLGAIPPPLVDFCPPADEDELPPAQDFELPLHIAALPQRFTASLLDALVVVLGSGMFGLIVGNSSVDLPHTRPMLALALAVPVFFWFVYNYLFLVYAGITPGMSLCRVRLRGFDEERVPCSMRRWRAVGMLLSGASLGIGFLWAWFDPDRLCWHDRISRSYVTSE